MINILEHGALHWHWLGAKKKHFFLSPTKFFRLCGAFFFIWPVRGVPTPTLLRNFVPVWVHLAAFAKGAASESVLGRWPQAKLKPQMEEAANRFHRRSTDEKAFGRERECAWLPERIFLPAYTFRPMEEGFKNTLTSSLLSSFCWTPVSIFFTQFAQLKSVQKQAKKKIPQAR